MQSGSLNKLVIITVAVAAGATWAWQGFGSGPLPERGRLLIPTFSEQINAATSIELISAGGSISLRRNDGDWVITEWDGYPADYGQVKQTLMGLADLVIIEAKTAKASKHAELGLEQPGTPGAASLGLSVTGSGDASLVNVVLGNPRTGQSEQFYARRAGEDQTWLVSGPLTPPRELPGWVDKELLRLAAKDLNRVVVSHPDGEVVEIRKGEDASWTLADVPEDRTVKAGANLTSLAGALAYLDMQSVVSAAEQTGLDLEWTTTRFERADGFVLSASSAEAGEERWARFEVSLVEPAAQPVEGEGAAEAAEAARLALTEEVGVLNARLGGWTYRISTWNCDSLRKHLEDFLEELPAEAGPDGPMSIEEPALPMFDDDDPLSEGALDQDAAAEDGALDQGL